MTVPHCISKYFFYLTPKKTKSKSVEIDTFFSNESYNDLSHRLMVRKLFRILDKKNPKLAQRCAEKPRILLQTTVSELIGFLRATNWARIYAERQTLWNDYCPHCFGRKEKFGGNIGDSCTQARIENELLIQCNINWEHLRTIAIR